MGYGYPAAKALAQLTGEISRPEVQRLLESDNIWLRAGALAGLAQARVPGIEDVLDRLLDERQPGLIQHEAAVCLARLGARRHDQSYVRRDRSGTATTGPAPD
jgi:hypothetical protein